MKNIIKNLTIITAGLAIFFIYAFLGSYFKLPNPMYVLIAAALITAAAGFKQKNKKVKIISICCLLFFLFVLIFSSHMFFITYPKFEYPDLMVLGQLSEDKEPCKVKGFIKIEKDNELTPLPGVSFKLWFSDGKKSGVQELKTDANGEYEFFINPGLYRFMDMTIETEIDGYIPIFSSPPFSYYEFNNMNYNQSGPEVIFCKPLVIKGIENESRLPKEDITIKWEDLGENAFYKISVNRITEGEKKREGTFMTVIDGGGYSIITRKTICSPEFLLELSEFKEGQYRLSIEAMENDYLYTRSLDIEFYVE